MTILVAISGFGVFSAFGYGPKPLLENVFEGRPGFRVVTRFNPTRYRSRYAGQSVTTPSLADAFRDVALHALEMAGLSAVDQAAVLLGTPGDLTGLTSYWRSGDPTGLPAATAGFHAETLAARLGLPAGRRRSFINGCIAASTAIVQGAQLVAGGREKVVLAGGGYLVEEESFAKFDSGRALSTTPAVRPFSRDRTGMLLGDAVAVLVLEPLHEVRARDAEPLAVLAGWGAASDSYHMCRPSAAMGQHPVADLLADLHRLRLGDRYPTAVAGELHSGVAVGERE